MVRIYSTHFVFIAGHHTGTAGSPIRIRPTCDGHLQGGHDEHQGEDELRLHGRRPRPGLPHSRLHGHGRWQRPGGLQPQSVGQAGRQRLLRHPGQQREWKQCKHNPLRFLTQLITKKQAQLDVGKGKWVEMGSYL